jgi:hypothetical protein
MKRIIPTIALSLAVCGLASSPAAARPLRVDLGMDTGRSDTATPGWTEWQVPDGAEATRDFDGVRVTLRGAGEVSSGATGVPPVEAGEDSPLLRGVWSKKLLATGARMAADGVTVEHGGLVIEIAGLPPGPHALVTYHSTVTGPPAETHRVVAAGTNDVAIEVTPTQEVADNADAASGYVEFVAVEGEAALVQVTSDADVILNGFEIDSSDPVHQAIKPYPADLDWHVDADDRKIELSWTPSACAPNHEVHVTWDIDPAKAEAALAVLGRGHSPGFRPSATRNAERPGRRTMTMDADPNLPILHYRWRVDTVDANGNVTRGDVWAFRVRHLAFPGAEGYGRFAIGGRGGKVYKVTTLADDGPGSLREAVEADEPRTVVFDVSGRIVLQSTLGIRNPYLTIAGQTAPGKGICIANYNMGAMGCHDLIIRYMRVRPGNTSGETLDGMGMASTTHAIYDHCSISWSHDEAFSSRGAGNITLQRTLISEALNVAGHRNYEEGKQHGYAASIGGDIGSFHHNLLAHCSGRNWSLAGGLDQATRHAGRLDIRNNVVYNWGHRTTDGGAKEVQFVNNYYKPGPASDVFHVLMAEREAVEAFGPQMYFVEGNVMEGRFGADEPLAGVFERRGEPHEDWIVAEPFYESFVTTQSAEEAYESVLADVGCNVPFLDEHDERVIDETRRGVTTYKGSVSGLPGLPDTQDDVGGWDDYPEIHRPTDWDPDNDGLPSAWETEQGLDPANPDDTNGDLDTDGYTNLEEYLNSLSHR